MTYDEKELLSYRIDNAVQTLDADYERAQAAACQAHERYFHLRELAEQYHAQRMILLEAQHRLWNNEGEF